MPCLSMLRLKAPRSAPPLLSPPPQPPAPPPRPLPAPAQSPPAPPRRQHLRRPRPLAHRAAQSRPSPRRSRARGRSPHLRSHLNGRLSALRAPPPDLQPPCAPVQAGRRPRAAAARYDCELWLAQPKQRIRQVGEVGVDRRREDARLEVERDRRLQVTRAEPLGALRVCGDAGHFRPARDLVHLHAARLAPPHMLQRHDAVVRHLSLIHI
eukprot:1455594-Prymnesium_polylepis.2